MPHAITLKCVHVPKLYARENVFMYQKLKRVEHSWFTLNWQRQPVSTAASKATKEEVWG